MKLFSLPLCTLLASACLFASFAKADDISTPGNGPIILDQDTADQSSNPASYNTVTFNPASQTVAVGAQFVEPLTFTSGYDGIGGPQPFSFNQDITVDGTTGSYFISGVFLVSPTTDPDTFTIFAGAPLTIGADTLTLESLSFPDNPPYPGGIATNNLTFDVAAAATPEPGSLALLGTGLLAGVGMLRRTISR